MKTAFIGAGNMAEALVRGLLGAGQGQPADLLVADVAAARRDLMRRTYGVAVAADNTAAVQAADMVVLAVKPQVLPAVLDEIAPALHAGQLVASIAAGFTIGRLESALGRNARLVRAMPNMPALAGAGVTVYCRNRAASPDDARAAARLFDAVGFSMEMDESLLDAVTALSGSGPAYVFYLCEAMTRAAIELGLPPAPAARLAAGTVFGAGCLLRDAETSAAELRRRVTSPGGTTEAAVRVLEKRQVAESVAAAMQAACRRAAELSGASPARDEK